MRFFTTITKIVLPLYLLFATVALGESAQRLIKILAFGDSLTAGYRLPKEAAYPAQLEVLLKNKGWNVQITNAGVSGDTTDQGLRRVDWNLKQGPFDVVLLELGANDGLRALPLSDMEKNLHLLVKRFEAHKSQVMLLGMKLPINLDKIYRHNFELVFAKVAKTEKVAFVSFMLEGVAAHEFLNLDDQMHPNEKGQVIVAKHIALQLEPLLKEISKHD